MLKGLQTLDGHGAVNQPVPAQLPVWKRKYLWNQWVPCCLRVPMCISMLTGRSCVQSPSSPESPTSRVIAEIGKTLPQIAQMGADQEKIAKIAGIAKNW
jgi:hypothetical protein